METAKGAHLQHFELFWARTKLPLIEGNLKIYKTIKE